MSSSRHSRSTPPDSGSSSGLPESAVNVYAPASDTFSPGDYAVGQVISGRFRVERVIGIGSMGVVLEARHLELDERVAIKFIRAEAQKMPGVMSRFAREAKAAVSIKSEHVAQVFDVGMADGIGPYIVMEYLDGQDLGAHLEEHGALSIRQAVHYVMQACEALAVAHSASITHRDIKPENLFLTRQGDLELIKLLDFGISKAALTGRVFGDELSTAETSCLLGTPLYMSPEQIRSTAEVDHRSDIWSLGAVLYELVSAKSAFAADSVRDVLTRILEASPAPLAMHLDGVPPSFQAVVDRCLEKDPDKRFQSVAELAIALLPFAPSRARLYAQRASSILGDASDSIIPAPMPSAPAGMRASMPFSSEPGGSSAAIVSLPDISAPPVTGLRQPSMLGRRRTPFVLAAALVAVTLLGVVLWLRNGGMASAPGGSAALSPPAPGDLTSPAADPKPLPPAQRFEPKVASVRSHRMLEIESEPSGARVELNGKRLGKTPVSARVPVGAVRLRLSKDGYRDREQSFDLTASADGATPLSRRFSLSREAKPVTRERRTRRRASRPAPRPRPAPPPPAPRATRSTPPASAAAASTDHDSARATTEKARLLETDSRARLLEDRRPARLLD